MQLVSFFVCRYSNFAWKMLSMFLFLVFAPHTQKNMITAKWRNNKDIVALGFFWQSHLLSANKKDDERKYSTLMITRSISLMCIIIIVYSFSLSLSASLSTARCTLCGVHRTRHCSGLGWRCFCLSRWRLLLALGRATDDDELMEKAHKTNVLLILIYTTTMLMLAKLTTTTTTTTRKKI